uniref:Uncharacterized protein n=1 Tax=Kalanchoe fedtschenkoi TaxID=63787 RepID=A0A7N1A191_KALFE
MICRPTLKRLSLMTSKPQRLHQLAGMTIQSEAKKLKVESAAEGSAMKDAFGKYADYLNELNDKRERLVKASRDITMNSKKVIFQVHRVSKDNKDEVLKKAEKDLKAVTDQHLARLVKELNGTDFWKLRRAFSPGVQEYIEAATLPKRDSFGTRRNKFRIVTAQ